MRSSSAAGRLNAPKLGLSPPSTYTPPPGVRPGGGAQRSRSSGGGAPGTMGRSRGRGAGAGGGGGAKPSGRGELLEWLNTFAGASYASVPDLKDGLIFAQCLQYYTTWSLHHLLRETDASPGGCKAMPSARAALIKDWRKREALATSFVQRLKWNSIGGSSGSASYNYEEEDTCLHNMGLVRDMLRNCVPRQWTLEIEPSRVASGKLQDLMILVQWLYGYACKVKEKYPLGGGSAAEEQDEQNQNQDENEEPLCLTTPLQWREQFQAENPSVLLRPELLWTRGSSRGNRGVAAPAASAIGGTRHAHYDPRQYTPPHSRQGVAQGGGLQGGAPGSGRLGSSPPHHQKHHLAGAGGQGGQPYPMKQPRSQQEYLQPLLDHLERNETLVEEKILLRDDHVAESEARLAKMTRIRNELRSALTDVAEVINQKHRESPQQLNAKHEEMARLFASYGQVFQQQ